MMAMLFNSSEQYADDPAFEPPLTNLWRNHVDRCSEGRDTSTINEEESDSDSSKYSAPDGRIDDMVLSEIWARHSRRQDSSSLTPLLVTSTASDTKTEVEAATSKAAVTASKVAAEAQTRSSIITTNGFTSSGITKSVTPDQGNASSPANVLGTAGPVPVQGSSIVVTTTLPSSLRDSLTPGLPSQTAGTAPGVTTGKSSNRAAIIAPTVVAVLIGVIFLVYLTRYLILRRRRQLRIFNAWPVTEDIIDAWDARAYVQDFKHPQPDRTESGVAYLGPSTSDVLSNATTYATHLYETPKPLSDPLSNSTIPLGTSTSWDSVTANTEGVSSVITDFLDSLSPEGREELKRTLASSEMTGSSGWGSSYLSDRVQSFVSQGTAPPEYQV